MDIRHAVGVNEGVPAQTLAEIQSYRGNDLFSAREQAALEFGERTARDDLEMTDACLIRLREHFTEPEVVELAFITGFQVFASKFAKAFRVAPQGFSVAT
jgi:alkylhydroperoxidase family enzyme